MPKSPTLPMLSARTLAQEIAAKRISPEQAFAMGEEAAKTREDRLNIYAHKAETLAEGKGPLRGITMGVKDIFDTFDMPSRSGSPIYDDHNPPADASVVAMARQAGATVCGKTVTTEFAWFHPGKTRNPHNPAHTPGGSSSGSAAGVAAGYFPASIGSQTGGSVIRPASFCGVAGYKPSFRLFPTLGMKQFSWSLDTVGFFAASVADVAFVAAHVADRDLLVNETAKTPPVIGVLRSSIDDLMEQDMAAALKHAAQRAKAWGAAVGKIKSPKTVEAARAAHAPIQGYEAFRALAHERTHHAEQFSAPLRRYMKECANIDAQAYDEARRTANQARKASHTLFDKCDVLLVPSAPGAAPRTLKSTGDSRFNQLWTLLGMPCVNVAGMKDENGMPLGVQIIAPFGQDQKALQAAHWLETVLAENT
ncbi:MAG: amidase [Pseudomonadota bacterium]